MGHQRPRWPAPPPDSWCHEHHRPLGPDNRCPLCVQGEAPARSERRAVLLVIAIALLGGIGPAAYYFFWAGHAEERRSAASASQTADRDSKRKRKPVATQERWVDEVKPSTGKADPEEARPRPTRSQQRANHRAQREAPRGGSRAKRSPTSAPRPRARVPITMYMAHW
jgi:hypothetical protein